MPIYRPAAQDFCFSRPILELEPFEIKNGIADKSGFVHHSFLENGSISLVSRLTGLVGREDRQVEVWSTPSGFLLKVEDGSDFYISHEGFVGCTVLEYGQLDLLQLDREILVGPALVLALAIRDVWSLHASAVMYKDNVIVFLGESGMGKSTLAAHLSEQTGWQLVADDILPVKKEENGLQVLPHFPQLKLPMDQQPGVDLPEQLPLKAICTLKRTEIDQIPQLQKMNASQTVRALLGNIAGTRMFNAELLAKHLDFSARAAVQVPAYQLTYPHRRDTLSLVKELLEKALNYDVALCD